ncbi:MAG: metallophosphoesterase [Cyanobacteria bacterium P01_A01_bin.114]
MKKLIRNGIVGVVGFIALLLLWGVIEPYVLEVKEETATIPDLPEAWEGRRIGQISDFQLGMWMHNISTARRSVEYLVEQRPAAVIVSGDFIYKSLPNAEAEIDKVLSVLKPLTEADIPTYAVLGNHDYSHKPPIESLGQQVETALEEAGIQVLQNESVVLVHPDSDSPEPSSEQSLYLVGIGSLIAEHDLPEQALSQVAAENPRIVMMHNPGSFAKFPAESAPFAMAGHTHGGQIRLPFLPRWSWLSLVKNEEVYGDGWIKDYGEPGNQLYVNRGIGFSDVPIRINCRPEVTLFTLSPSP